MDIQTTTLVAIIDKIQKRDSLAGMKKEWTYLHKKINKDDIEYFVNKMFNNGEYVKIIVGSIFNDINLKNIRTLKKHITPR